MISRSAALARARRARQRRALVAALALVAVAVRFLHLQIARDTPLLSLHRTFAESDMHMFDQWARHIAAGDWLGRERYHPLYEWQLAAAPAESWQRQYGSTPVFYKAPFYAYLIALLHSTLGEPMLALAGLQILACAASVALVCSITRRLFGMAAGAAAGLLLALYAPDVHYSVAMLRGPWIVLVALLVTAQLARLLRSPSARQAVGLGMALALALLVNEGFLLLPVLVVAAVAAGIKGRAASLAAPAALGFLAVYSPILAHNAMVGAPWPKLAVTGGTVFAIFNAARASPFFFEIRPSVFLPLADPDGALLPTALACLRSFEGPVAIALFYLRKTAGLLIPFENPDNVSFYYAAHKDPLLAVLPGYALLLPLACVGIVLAARHRQRLLPLLPVSLSLLLSILLTLPLSRYRSVLAVFLMPFAGLTLARGWRWAAQRRFGRVLGAAAAALALWGVSVSIQQRVVFAQRPAAALMYRPSEFQLGIRFYADRRRFASAAAEATALARLNPDPDVKAAALLIAARLQLERGDAAASRASLTASLGWKSEDPALLLDAGDLYAGPLRDRGAARESYLRAAALAPDGPLRELARSRLARLEE